MSWLKSNGFPSPFAHPGEEQSAAPESVSPLAPMQPFDEVQPLPVEPAQEPFRPLQPLESAPPVSAPPVPTPEEVANLGVPLGTLIFRAGLLTEEQLEDALQAGVRSGKRLGEVLLESGLLDEHDLGRLARRPEGPALRGALGLRARSKRHVPALRARRRTCSPRYPSASRMAYRSSRSPTPRTSSSPRTCVELSARSRAWSWPRGATCTPRSTACMRLPARSRPRSPSRSSLSR